jgi:drug/metabolite transporter (DMT)-like permease
MLQIIGAILMVGGSLLTQRSSDPSTASKLNEPAFKPRVAVGFFFALIAALAYGSSPIVVRQALQNVGPLSGVAGASVAYAAATLAVTLGLVIPSLRRNVMGIFVAAAHGFLYSALAVAPIMLVAPLLQLSLVFRFLFALLLNPHHEVFGLVVILGTVVSIFGACAIAIDTSVILHALAIPEPLATYLRSPL